MGQAYDRAVHALREAFVAVNGRNALRPDNYAHTLTANLLYPMSPETQHDLTAGAGQELKKKSRAPHSSTVMVVNTFEPWRAHCGQLELAGVRSFKKITFEKKCPTGLAGTPPHLDLIAETTDAVVAVESKCLEYLNPDVRKLSDFAASYKTLADEYGTRDWFRYVVDQTPSSPQHLNIAQLVKHWLGLCQMYGDRRVALLYIYWEPENWRQVPECRRHRLEIRAFADRVAGDTVSFHAISYLDLWAHWERLPAPTWITSHVAGLRQRYAVTI